MKKTTLFLVIIAVGLILNAQSPKSFKYQAVVRDNGGHVLTNQNVSFQIAIVWDLSLYIPSYYETHTSTTNEFGQVTLEIGNGTATFGGFDTINWSRGNYFLEIGFDPDGTDNYALMGTAPLLAVPYALYAESSADSSRWSKVLNDIYYNEGAVGIGTDVPIAPLTINGVVGPDILFGPDFESDIMTHNIMNLGAYDSFDVNLLTNNFVRLTIDENGKVGIGTQSPTEQLELTDNIKLPASADSLHGVVIKGDKPFIHDYKAPGSWGDNLFIGKNSGNFTMTIDGQPNHSSRNTALGDFALNNITSGYENCAFGFDALRYNTTGYGNSAMGVASLYFNTKGYGNTAIGFKSMIYSDSSNYNTAVGYQSMLSNNEGNQNTGIGYSALSSNTLGSDNVALGYTAMTWPAAGSKNVCIGSQAGYSSFNANFSGNVAIGYMAGRNLNNNADYNVLIGSQTGSNITSGFRNILIGSFVNAPIPEGSYQLSIGDVIYGNLLSGKIGIGVNNPAYELEVSGTVQATAFQGDGSLLTGTGDNLGNHLSTQNIKLNNHWLSGDGGNEGIYINSAGKVGIGTNSFSDAVLDVHGNNINMNVSTGQGMAFRMRENDEHRWTFLYRPWVNSTLTILDEVGNKSLMVFEPITGCVGLNITNPEVAFHITGGSDAALASGGYLMTGTSTSSNIVIDDNEIMARNNLTASNLFINHDGGNVGIGTSANNLLDVQGLGSASGGITGYNEVTAHFKNTSNEHSAISIDANSSKDAIIYLAESGSPLWSIRTDVSDDNGVIIDNVLEFRNQKGGLNEVALRIFQRPELNKYYLETEEISPALSDTYECGNWGSYWWNVNSHYFTTWIPSDKFKNNSSLQYGLKEVLKLKPVTYNDNQNTSGSARIALNPEEVYKIIPEITDNLNEQSDSWGLRYDELIPVLINAIQEQQEQIEDLKAQVNSLSN